MRNGVFLRAQDVRILVTLRKHQIDGCTWSDDMRPLYIKRDLPCPAGHISIALVKRGETIWGNNIEGRVRQPEDSIEELQIMHDGRALESIDNHNGAAFAGNACVQQRLDIISRADLSRA